VGSPARAALAAIALGTALSAGCAGYRLGSALPPGVRSVHVPTFRNNSGEPEAEVYATRATIQEFQKDGTLRVASPQEADALLEVVLVAAALEPLRYETDRAKATAEYRFRLTADLRLLSTATGQVLLNKRVEGDRTFDVEGDLSSSKRRVFPQVANDLAHEIVESVVEFW
jgi:hypothetical protein